MCGLAKIGESLCYGRNGNIIIKILMKILMKVLHIIIAWHIIRADREVDIMSVTLLDLTERLVPISDFSQGKAGKIFNDVAENNNEYIILKNNQPTAVLLSVKEYRDTQEKVAKLEALLEKIENIRLLKLAESRTNDNTSSFESFVNEQGYTMEELEEISESVEFE